MFGRTHIEARRGRPARVALNLLTYCGLALLAFWLSCVVTVIIFGPISFVLKILGLA